MMSGKTRKRSRWWGFDGVISPARYFATGVLLAAVKLPLDNLFSGSGVHGTDQEVAVVDAAGTFVVVAVVDRERRLLRPEKVLSLHEAAGCNFHEGISTLLTLGADPTLVDGRGRTPEQLAEVCGFEDAVTVLRAARSAT